MTAHCGRVRDSPLLGIRKAELDRAARRQLVDDVIPRSVVGKMLVGVWLAINRLPTVVPAIYSVVRDVGNPEIGTFSQISLHRYGRSWRPRSS